MIHSVHFHEIFYPLAGEAGTNLTYFHFKFTMLTSYDLIFLTSKKLLLPLGTSFRYFLWRVSDAVKDDHHNGGVSSVLCMDTISTIEDIWCEEYQQCCGNTISDAQIKS